MQESDEISVVTPGKAWIVLDVRDTENPILDPRAKFARGFTRSLASALCEINDETQKPVSLLLISYKEPYNWIIEVAQEFPQLIKYWSGGPFSNVQSFQKLIPLSWSSFCFGRLSSLIGEKFVWISMKNFDRPTRISNKKYSENFVQIVNDSRDFFKLPGTSFIRRVLGKIILKRNINNRISTYISSQFLLNNTIRFSARKLNEFPKVFHDGLDDDAGKFMRSANLKEEVARRKELLSDLIGDHFKINSEALSSSVISGFWILAVGQSERYFCWDTIYRAVRSEQLRKSGVWVLRIGFDVSELLAFSKKNDSISFQNFCIFPNLKLAFLTLPTQVSLYRIMSLSNLFVHPCLHNVNPVFVLESVCCGLPVLYLKNKDIDDISRSWLLGKHFITQVDSNSIVVWANEIRRFFKNYYQSDAYNRISKVTNVRKYIDKNTDLQKFRWEFVLSDFFNSVIKQKVLE